VTGPTTALPDLVRDGVLDAELASLCWLLVESGVPFVVTGDVDTPERLRLAEALIHLPPDGPSLIVDLDVGRPAMGSLAAFMRGGMRLAAVARAAGLRELIDTASAPPDGLPEDAVRRLGLVLVLANVPTTKPGLVTDRVRVVAAHYLRPLERDGAGHVQRRPPGVLATLDVVSGAYDHFAWGLTPELADRADRSQATFEELLEARAAALAALAADAPGAPGLIAILAAEPPRVPAPARPAAVPSQLQSPLTDPHIH
jgi:hypothetical protein